MARGLLHFLVMPIDFDQHHSDMFTPALFSKFYSEIVSGFATCGPCALATLTHECPLKLADRCLEKDQTGRIGTTDSTMLAVLKEYNITAQEITDTDICTGLYRMRTLISSSHVLLISQRATLNLNSWFVYWNGWQFHNLTAVEFDKLEFLNRPPIHKYLLSTDHWSKKTITKDFRDAVRKAKREVGGIHHTNYFPDIPDIASKTKYLKSTLESLKSFMPEEKVPI